MIGNFVPEKDQFTLVKAFDALRVLNSKLKLILIGKEYLEPVDCKKFISEHNLNNVYLLGSLINADKYLGLFDCFVLSSKAETFGISLVEALLTKVPVIASDIPVFKELSENGRYFKLFKTGNVMDLAKKIEQFLQLDYLLSTNINESFLYAKKNFSYDSYVNKLSSYYTL
jgi:glycosyltransferase involved in cell wall biosynthesis